MQCEIIARYGLNEDELNSSALEDSLKTYAQICSLDNPEIYNIMANTEMMGKLVKLLESKDSCVNAPAVKVLGNILSYPGCSRAIDMALHCGVFSVFRNLLSEVNTHKMKEIVWCIANIIAEGPEYVKLFLEDDYLYERIKQLTKNTNLDLKKEAIYVILNMINLSDQETMLHLIRDDILVKILVGALQKSIDTRDYAMLIQIFEAMEKLLESDFVFQNRRNMAEKFVNYNVFEGL